MEAERSGGEEERPESNTLKPSLFPLSANLSPDSLSSSAPQWLSNASFTFDVSSLPGRGSDGPHWEERASPDYGVEASGAAADGDPTPARPPQRTYDLVPSSPSESSSKDERRSKGKERRRRKRKREKERLDDGASRKSEVRAWAGSDTQPTKDYYFDAHGDRDNLAFGCLYRFLFCAVIFIATMINGHIITGLVHLDVPTHATSGCTIVQGERRGVGGQAGRKWWRKRDGEEAKELEEDEYQMGAGAAGRALRQWMWVRNDEQCHKRRMLRPVQEGGWGVVAGMDIARYKIHNYGESSRSNFWASYRWRSSALNMDTEGDYDVLDNKLKSGGRYYSAKLTMLERDRAFKNTKFVKRVTSSVIPGDFVPLSDSHSSAENVPSETRELEESWEDEVIRRTRDFNKMSRDCPHDEKVWLDFSEFQKISILEKAVELNPNSEDLLLCLLKSYQRRDSIDTSIEKWERILIRHSESCKLWKEFLLVCQGDFSRFKEFANSQSGDSSLVQLELGLVDIFVSYCRFEWQAGYQELATGLFQAELEYNLFCPSLTLSSHSKLRLFDHFWKSGVARVGEDGALGWSSWLEKDEQNRQNTTSEDSTAETEVGGWSGWFELSSKKNVPSKDPEVSVEPPIDNEKTEQNLESKENLDTEEIPPGDDIEALLKKLGIDIDSEPNSEVKDTDTWNKWSKEELLRESEQWMPVHEDSGLYGRPFSPFVMDGFTS
ncbi:hypothetical protein GW17_00014162 [Ensete ventricosum]|nr:hypothetical protein GW17_00014162 [Ensete ventricosum]